MNTFLEIVVGEFNADELQTLVSDTSLFLPLVLLIGIALTIIAFFSYRFFRLCLVLGTAVSCSYLGVMFIAPLLNGIIPEVEWISIPAVVGIISALLGALLANIFYKVALFLSGGAIGFFAVSFIITVYFPSLIEYGSWTVYLIGGIAGLVIGALMALFFKVLYILVSSVGSMALAGLLLGYVIFPNNPMFALIVAGIGVIPGICAMIFQFSSDD